MKEFMGDDFLLTNPTAYRLYHDYAKDLPIFDYHSHLSAKDIAENRQYNNLAEAWLQGDHYKWRGMRAAGIDESYITGTRSDYEKFQAWASTVPKCLGNPLYHWTHLELRRPFGINDIQLGPETADNIWAHCNEKLSMPEYSSRGILQQMNVHMVGTTDDPIDSLEHHAIIAKDDSFSVAVLPSWRPDRAFKIETEGFSEYMQALGNVTGIDIVRFEDLLAALNLRLDHFDEHGCCTADHGIEILRYAQIPTLTKLDDILQLAIKQKPLTEDQIDQFTTAVLVWLGQQYTRLGWVMQLHLGALRDNNSRMLATIGPNTGYDSIADTSYAKELSSLLNAMDITDELPKTVLYCLNPRDNEMLATMAGNFQGGGIAGKIQFGSGWWFNDQKDGMERQLQQLSQLGLLSQFIGMLTDSRSILSFTRHEYFRRILCNMLGEWVEQGEVPNRDDLLVPMIKDICFYNAQRYFLSDK